MSFSYVWQRFCVIKRCDFKIGEFSEGKLEQSKKGATFDSAKISNFLYTVLANRYFFIFLKVFQISFPTLNWFLFNSVKFHLNTFSEITLA